ncbi:hypothetical protein NLJ89_g1521 [Agrocybe chaxingu]|uniref:GID complex catalytic subunit 2 n=1 Tax=Agrocybe chaxingu TaxID=84603 RepID=A0A9W8TDA1_9AGAR|nr:hypothetical protein NLJ89_g1521 [Agrocybe chaxingu]
MNMDASLKELTKLEKLTAASARGPSIGESLDSLLESLREARSAFLAGNCSEECLKQLAQTVESKKKEVDERQKEVYNVLARLGKALDKESKIQISEELRNQFVDLHQILKALRSQDIAPALKWARSHQSFLKSRNSPLEFYLHRSQYINLLLSSHPPDPLLAIAYAKINLSPFCKEHEAEFRRLLTCIAYLPLAKLQSSSYRDLAQPTLHFDLEPLFAKEYCANLGMSRQVPLRVVGDIGGGGALARIEKGRKVLGDRKGEWTQMDELPIEIPLPSENRYHSIFACLVSKEQSTESNPPMMMTCGHVISKDSLQKLNKSSGRAKCPYCPGETNLGAALRLYL